MTNILDVEGLDVWVEREAAEPLHIVRGLSFGLRQGERLAVVGESGSGKSTAALALLGLLPATAIVAGSAMFMSTELLTPRIPIGPHRWRDIAAVFQGSMNAFSPVTTIGRQIAEPMILHQGLRRSTARRRSEDLLRQVGLRSEHFDSFPHELSGGMRQRAVLAMGLACEPKLLIADEPTTALDLMVQAQVLELLYELSCARDLALIIITHDLAAVSQVCDSAMVMYAGEVVEKATIATLTRSPQHPYTRRLFEAIPSLDVGHPLRSIPGTPPSPELRTPGCPFAPRCDQVLPACATVTPRPATVSPDHLVACLLHEAAEASDD